MPHLHDEFPARRQTLNQVVFNVNLNEEISALNLIDKVEDQSEVIAYFLEDDGTKNTTLKFTKKGSYIVNIIVEDVVGNQAAKLRAKIVVGSLGNHPTLESCKIGC